MMIHTYRPCVEPNYEGALIGFEIVEGGSRISDLEGSVPDEPPYGAMG